MIKSRTFESNNYRGIYFNGKTIRIALNPDKPITELDYPEFYDVKITDNCSGKCPWCYMDSKPDAIPYENVVEKIYSYFGAMDNNQKPFQVAIGGGEPTESPEFIDCLGAFYDLGITPNYTTNGMFLRKGIIARDDITEATKKYCGGVAVSCHPHLKEYWLNASSHFYENDIKLNFHIIISDKESCDYFINIYEKWKDEVDYFVLLPYGSQGRAEHKDIDWDYLVSVMPDDVSKIAFGANFYPYLMKEPNRFNVSLYEPESMSKYLDLKDMKMYPSSFHTEEVKGDVVNW